MALFSISNIKISGIAAALPANTESNADLANLSDEDKALLIKTTECVVANKNDNWSGLLIEAKSAKILYSTFSKPVCSLLNRCDVGYCYELQP